MRSIKGLVLLVVIMLMLIVVSGCGAQNGLQDRMGRVQAGMSLEEVRRLLGEPERVYDTDSQAIPPGLGEAEVLRRRSTIITQIWGYGQYRISFNEFDKVIAVKEP